MSSLAVSLAPEHRIERFENRKMLELLNTQKELEENFHSGDRGHKGEYAETVTEVGGHGNRKKMNPEDKKIR